jgi:hypothetical protein
MLGELHHGSVVLVLTDYDHMVAALAELRGEINCIELRAREPQPVETDQNSQRAILIALTVHNDVPSAISSGCTAVIAL